MLQSAMGKLIAVSVVSALIVLITFFLPYGTWAEIGELPAHPLIVHGVIVLLPIISILLIVAFFKKSHLVGFQSYIIAALAIITTLVIAAKSSGNSLSAAVGLPKEHAELGNNLPPIVMGLLLVTIVYYLTQTNSKLKIVTQAFGILMITLSLAAVGMTYLVGHSGAEAVWKFKYQNSLQSFASDEDLFSGQEVAEHNTASDCWIIMNGKVYDVTPFVNRHPGGASEITEMCGTDASEDFLGEHSGQKEPEKWLETLMIGTLRK